jgi:valyl-tRNA synthetase
MPVYLPAVEPIEKSFEPADIESTWYPRWERAGYFRAGVDPTKHDHFCIQLPPPNVTGTLHMGHGFNQTLMDALTRYHRMKGANTLWQPGTDHAGIATQMVVERQLDAQGLSRHDLGRASFLEKVWEWKRFSGNTITQQMRRLGACADWERERFTMDEGLSKIVTQVFVQLYREGLIYRGKRLVNWDPKLMTAVSDLEVIQEEEDGYLWHIRYPLAHPASSENEGVTIATTRPETLLGDVAVMVHPEDDRYKHLVGQHVRLPLCDREIPIIADAYVDPAFGTGAVKVTPAHDFNDWQVGIRHGLTPIGVLTLDGHINMQAPSAYRGLDRLIARQRILADLETAGLLVKTENYRLKIPRGDRSGTIIEPMLTDQWFVAMQKPDQTGCSITQRALDKVASGEIRFVPDNWVNTYNQWLGNIQDWCISRQLWWGHQIPAWYASDGRLFVAYNEEQARQCATSEGYTGELTRDPDVLDTWFSSALWPFSTLDWTGDAEQDAHNTLLNYYLPSTVLVTGFDIIFFWVARMIMMTTHVTGKIPFRDVYVHGLIRDAEGQKMSKSKGNVLDPIDLIDGIDLETLVKKRTSGLMNPKDAQKIEKRTRREYPQGIPAFGADALRLTFASLASPGRDIKFDLQRCEGYRNFCNKLWNAARFILMNCSGQAVSESPTGMADRWIKSQLAHTIAAVDRHFAAYRFDLVAKAIYELVWDEYCDWYLEMVKVRLQQGSADEQAATRHTAIHVLEMILRMAHPLLPFMTEALWQKVIPLVGPSVQPKDTSIMVQAYPDADTTSIDACAQAWMDELKALVSACRSLRAQMNLSPAQRVPLIAAGDPAKITAYAPYLSALAKLSEVSACGDHLPASPSPSHIVGDIQILLRIDRDVNAEKARLAKEIERVAGEQKKAQTKLATESFLERAPEKVIALERQRLSDFTALHEQLCAQLSRLSSSTQIRSESPTDPSNSGLI